MAFNGEPNLDDAAVVPFAVSRLGNSLRCVTPMLVTQLRTCSDPLNWLIRLDRPSDETSINKKVTSVVMGSTMTSPTSVPCAVRPNRVTEESAFLFSVIGSLSVSGLEPVC